MEGKVIYDLLPLKAASSLSKSDPRAALLAAFQKLFLEPEGGDAPLTEASEMMSKGLDLSYGQWAELKRTVAAAGKESKKTKDGGNPALALAVDFRKEQLVELLEEHKYTKEQVEEIKAAWNEGLEATE
jgi:hypothetical protein